MQSLTVTNAPTLTLTPNSGPVGTSVTLSGSNYAAGTLTAKFGGATVWTGTASSGAIPSGASFTVASGSSTGSVTVTDSASNVGTATFTVSASAAKLVFTAGTAQSLTAGVVSPTAIVVQRQDVSGNPVLGSAITVSLSTTSTGGAFYSDSAGTTVITSITIASGSSSSASFYYKDTVAASPTLTGASSGLTSATTQFTIHAAALSKFILANIGTQTTGTAFSISITAQDQYANSVTSFSSFSSPNSY